MAFFEGGEGMFEVFKEQIWVSVGMGVFFALSILIKAMVAIYYSMLNHYADNMSTTDNKVLKQCRLKFLNCCEMNDGISNVPVFVEKFLNRLKIGPFYLHRLLIWSGQMMLLSVICAGIGIYRILRMNLGAGRVVPFYVTCFIGLYVYFNFSAVMDVRGKRRILKVNLVDYLENHLVGRYHTTQKDCKKLYGEEPGIPSGESPARRRNRMNEMAGVQATQNKEEQEKSRKETTEQELVKLLDELFIG